MKPNAFSKGARCLSLSLFVLIAAPAFAQDQAAQIETQQDITRRRQTTIEERPAAESVADPELGEISLVRRQQKPKMFTFSTNQLFSFTSNAFLVRDNTQSALLWNGRFGASYVPYSTRNFTPRITFEQNFFRYDRFSRLDFDSQSLQLDLKYDLTRDDSWFVNGSYGYTRLYSPRDAIGEFYKFGILNGSITNARTLGNWPITLGLTAGAYWRQGDPSVYDRVATYASAVAIYSIAENVQLTGFLRPELQFYTNDPNDSPRTDFNVTVGATLSWTPIRYVTLGATAAYVGNFSSVSLRRYDVATPGVIVAAQIAF
ncbi:MAG: hypothetical protein ACR2MF_02500 [Chthoniobacterales bacterium]